jgi:hypothetical protein
MKFFTSRWHGGTLGDDEHAAIRTAYRAHVHHIFPLLPATLRILVRAVPLHGGRIRRVVLDRANRELRLELRCGDRRMGHLDVDLTYLGVVIDAADVAVLAAAAREEGTELLADEVDLVPGEEGVFVHRLLWWPYRDCEIIFRELALRAVPRADDRRPLFNDRYVDVEAARVE